ncbi:glycoside hydrolase family 3 protein [Pelagibacterales bacterium SAG-MED22]|nr:glycoside hydrolase family 3 protein [Pelagibacterales bacterium SAG-MED22]
MISKRKAFITGIKSLKLTTSEVKFLKKQKPWGIILFSRNIKSINQTKLLTNSIRKLFKDPHYPILIDQEGGRVNRLKNIITFDNLTGEYFGKLYVQDKRKFNIIYKLFIDKSSYLLKQIGVNINTLPILDLRIKGASNIIGDRSFSENKKIVSKVGDICIDLFNQNSIGTVIKHIPGHGLAKVDSHNFTPIVDKNINYLIKNDFFPFKNKDSLFAMTAHIIYKKIDPLNTATHSKKIINIIRKKIRFKNVLISDDLSMKSLKYDLSTNTIKSFEAGCNLALHCNGNFNEMKVVAENSPLVNNFIIKKTSLFYKNLS